MPVTPWLFWPIRSSGAICGPSTRRLPIGYSTSSTAWRCEPWRAKPRSWAGVTSRVVDLTPEDYLDLVLHKTCWYTTIHPLRVGALLGSAEPSVLRAMVSFGFYLGAAFQIRDDLLNLTGAEGVYGKEINGDLYEAKRSLALIHLCGQATGEDRSLVHGVPGGGP